MTKDTKGIYDMNVEVTSGTTTKSEECESVTVYGLTVGNRTTNIDKTGNTLYLLQNASYTSTSMTAVNTNASANTTRNYYNLFVIENKKIKSVARDSYISGTNGSITFNETGTEYNIAASGNNIRISVSARSNWGSTQTYYVRQTSNTAVSMSTSTSNRNWNFLPVTYDMP